MAARTAVRAPDSNEPGDFHHRLTVWLTDIQVEKAGIHSSVWIHWVEQDDEIEAAVKRTWVGAAARLRACDFRGSRMSRRPGWPDELGWLAEPPLLTAWDGRREAASRLRVRATIPSPASAPGT